MIPGGATSATVCEAARRIREKNPGRVPIICEADKARSAPGWTTKRSKFLVSEKLNVSQFRKFVRSNLICNAVGEKHGKPPKVVLFLPTGEELRDELLGVADLDRMHKSTDGFLYLKYIARFSTKSETSIPPAHEMNTVEEEEQVEKSEEESKEGNLSEVKETRCGEEESEQVERETEDGGGGGGESIDVGSENVHSEDAFDSKKIDNLKATDASMQEQVEMTSPEVSINNTVDENNAKKSVQNTEESTSSEGLKPLSEEEEPHHTDNQHQNIVVEELEQPAAAHLETVTPELLGKAITEQGKQKSFHSQLITSELPKASQSQPFGGLFPAEEEDEESADHNSLKETSYVREREQRLEHPATAADIDDLYKSPLYSALSRNRPGYEDLTPPKFHLDENPGTGHGAYSRTATITERTKTQSALDAVLYNGFDSMVLSDDSTSNREDALSLSGGIDPTSGWPSLSRESTSDEGKQAPLYSNLHAQHHLNLRNVVNHNSQFGSSGIDSRSIFHQASERLSKPVLEDSLFSSSEVLRYSRAGEVDDFDSRIFGHGVLNEEEDWIEVDDGIGEFGRYQEGSFEKGKAFLLNKLSQIDLSSAVNKEALASKAASLKEIASNIIANRSYDMGFVASIASGVAARRPTNSFMPGDPPLSSPSRPSAEINSEDENEDEWTCLNFDAQDESFGARFV